jgi:hypothetical protein
MMTYLIFLHIQTFLKKKSPYSDTCHNLILVFSRFCPTWLSIVILIVSSGARMGMMPFKPKWQLLDIKAIGQAGAIAEACTRTAFDIQQMPDRGRFLF